MRTTISKRLAIASLTASALALSAGAAFADYTLNILHMNDWHSRIEPINKYDSTCSAEDDAEGKCFGGAARLVTAVAEARQALDGENVLLLNAGDNFQGSLFYTTYKGAAEAEFLNLMKTDAMVVGNHEFDDGEDGLATFLDKVEFPVLGSNVKAKEASALGDRVKEYLLLDVGGETIAIVGAVANDTAELSSPGENVSIIEDVAGITAAVEAATAGGANKVIALTHVGYPRDLEAIAKIPGVDVVVGGHSNTLLSNAIEGAEGPYPTMVDNPDGHQVPVVQAGSYSKYLGELKLTFNDDGVVTAATGDVKLIDASVDKDEAVVARVLELGGPIEELKNKIVAETAAPVDGSRETCRAGECEMGNLVTDAMVARTADQGVQFAITNGGGLRASIDGGEVTMGEVLGVLPFQNTLATFQIKGEDVVASLESGVSQIEDGAGRFPQVSGLRFSFDPSVAPGEGRIQSVEVKDGDGWTAIDPDATYTVASNNFTRNGGDGYKLFAENAQNAYDYGPGLEQVLADYLAANSPYKPSLDGRITKVAASTMDKAGETMDKAADDAKTMAEGVAEKAKEAVEGAVEGAKEMAEKAAGEADAAMKKMTEGAEKATEDAGNAVEKAADDAASMAKTAADKAGEAVESATEGAKKMADDAGKAMEKSADDAASATEGAADKVEEVAENAAEATGEMASRTAEDAEKMMDGDKNTYTIARGDTLWEIARAQYGDATKWRDIADANPQMDPGRLKVGMVITLPAAN
ncbi:5'-nucleotidase C-terminal domain-containing protein [Nitratireductor aquimarinus]|uniref:5'-nucleotidase C-terminal domain-containing protein n=1 Tax=Nitratireductor aquimarinus TaxID=889300 RepID=A0ABU4AGR9_9HYPH|nr:5'-nucleotidase C-terminal domain-containing protein [Nitratireductor aquimarinus]MDV6225434.1 5'-nucleotidase C-terminal domain-containing protein [Nitratireductor aquimarinus]